MKLFGFNITRTQQSGEAGNYSALSGNIFPKGDLSKPFINDRFVGGGGYVFFGSDNLYPQLMVSLYYTSPLHHAITNFKKNAIVGGGYELDFNDGDNVKVRQSMFNRLVQASYTNLTLDLVMHGRMYTKLTFDDKGMLMTAKRIDPSMVRHSRADIYGDVDKVFINRDWSTGGNTTILPTLNRSKKQKECVYMYQNPAAGLTTYALPDYSSAANWMFLDGEVSYLHKSNIINSINPSYILNFPRIPGSKQERENIKESLETKGTGAENAGRVITMFSPNREQMPDVITAATSQNDKLFLQTSKDLRDNICFSHEINPSIVGIKVAGSLGSSEELKVSYHIFDANVIKPNRAIMDNYFDVLIDIAQLSGSIRFLPSNINFE